ncbi:MAG: hypothetical protein RBS56_05130 [Candidatus Gracilibacteria bacterium]|jgi:hypothetical protein|nr:hypothetical protein [Candidatus Gracilibacteria bacterium]
MCISAFRFPKFEFSDKTLTENSLNVSGDEVLVRLVDKYAYLPVGSANGTFLARWGMCLKNSKTPLRFCRNESLESGKWASFSPTIVEIPVCLALSMGVWFQVRKAISGVLVENFSGERCVFVLTKPSTHYFEVMTGSKRMPVLINQIL